MATTKQKEAAKKNIGKARDIQSARAHGARIPKQSPGLSTSAKDKMPDNVFAFPKERKEPLNDARHIRNAIARFDQVEGVSDKEKDAAWKRIMKAAKQCDVEVNESSWRELGKSSKPAAAKSTASKSRTISKSSNTRSTASKSSASKSPTAKSSASKSPTAKSRIAKSPASKPKAAAGKK